MPAYRVEEAIVRWSALIICAGLALIALQLLGEFAVLLSSSVKTKPQGLSYVGITVLVIGGMLMAIGGLVGSMRAFAERVPPKSTSIKSTASDSDRQRDRVGAPTENRLKSGILPSSWNLISCSG
jgi:hypothetical protein